MRSRPRENPYPGLRPFLETEAHLFFGRDTLVDEMLLRLAESRFLGVVGSSGSGKSSLLRAGLIPRVQGGLSADADGDWRIVTMRPWVDPIGRLARELAQPGILSIDSADPVTPVMVETALRRSGLGLRKLLSRALPRQTRLLVIVDQFEELFRTGSTLPATFGDDAAALVLLLLEAVGEESAVSVLISMRSDFIGECARFHGLPELLSAHQYLVPRMTRDQLAEAITAPAAIAGASVAPRLAQQLLNDVESSQDQLPVLQHAMMRTWNKWAACNEDRRIDFVDYEAVGSVAHALNNHADQAYESLPEGQPRRIAERIFRAVTDQPPHAQPVRRPLRFAQLIAELGVTEAEASAVIDRFRGGDRHFLVTSDDPLQPTSVVDISHESLIRLWARVRAWLVKETEWKKRYSEIVTAAKRLATGKGSTWRDPELGVARQWMREDGPDEHWALRYGPPEDFQAAARFLATSERAQVAERWKRRALWAVVPVGVAVVLAVFLVQEQRRDAALAELNRQRVAEKEEQQRHFNEFVRRTAADSEKTLQTAIEDQRRTAGDLEEARAALEPGQPSASSLGSARQAIDRALARVSPSADRFYDKQQDLAKLQQRAVTASSPGPQTMPLPAAGALPRANALRGYKVGIYFIDGDPTAEAHARRVEAALKNMGDVTVQLYPRNQAFMEQVNRPQGDEIRYEATSGDEKRAADALQHLARDTGLGEFRLRTVGTPTPGFLSIMLADGVGSS